MNKIQLDLTKLLGFKIVASAATVGTLQSAKIGGKLCSVREDDVAIGRPTALAAKI